MFKQYFIESKNIEKELTALIKKNNAAVIIDSVGIEIFVDEVSGGWAYGIDQFDKDVEINLRKVGKEYRIQEGTSGSDIAQGSATFGKLHKKCKGSYEEGEDECTNESAVGQVGRTDAKSAMKHLTPELKKRFKKLLKDVGGKTVMRYLLADAPLQEGMKGGLKSDLESSLYTIQQNCYSKRMEKAIDEVLDLMDTDC
jgi:hypothetical protein